MPHSNVTRLRVKPLLAALVTGGIFICVWSLMALARQARGDSRQMFEFQQSSDCKSLANSGSWAPLNDTISCSNLTATPCGADTASHWSWAAPAVQCGTRQITQDQGRALFRDAWLVVAGDSIGRFFFAALLRLLSDSGEYQIVVGHRDFEYSFPGGTRATFLWAPYATNLTAHLHTWEQAKRAPDFLVLSCGLWHMLHITDPIDFAATMHVFKDAAAAFTQAHSKDGRGPQTALFSITEVYPPRLRTEEKRQHLTLPMVDAYNQAIAASGILAPPGTMTLIDMHHLTQGCGPTCTHDGLHYSNMTYDAAVQIFANQIRSGESGESQHQQSRLSSLQRSHPDDATMSSFHRVEMSGKAIS
ncbi:hypothetical protein WJX73_000604 [Symbiochloris irregularis]|uniref:SGNH domain-containing protein n=1 Tax=Symbiochloris irregularis TaxID=706552 RepID=A0AAW1NL63_9CHLO